MAVVSSFEVSRTGLRELPRESSRDIARVQIFKHVTKDRLIDIGDMLNLEARRSKVSFTLVAFDESFKATVRVRHYADVSDLKLVCWDILNGSFTEWTDYKGSRGSGRESGEDAAQARVLTIRKDPKYRQPFVIKIDNGVGEMLPGGAVKMVQATETLTLLLSEWDARRMAQTMLDYVRDWETVHFRKRQEAQTIVLHTAETAAN